LGCCQTVAETYCQGVRAKGKKYFEEARKEAKKKEKCCEENAE
jgi:hypothetical protein